jgi:hypothetical protein
MTTGDLSQLLRNLSVIRRSGRWCVVTNIKAFAGIEAAASIVEDEGVTSVITVADAERLGIEVDFVAAWLTLNVNSALDMVGLTAAVATALASEGIPCNVLAGYHHDHLLVPENDADRAVGILLGLRSSADSDARI